MPIETTIAVIAIAAPFLIFALTLAWADRYSRGARPGVLDGVPAE
jgi:hypothetical protein